MCQIKEILESALPDTRKMVSDAFDEIYDASRGNLFLTYTGKNIKNKMKDCIRKAKATLEGHLSYDQKCELMEYFIRTMTVPDISDSPAIVLGMCMEKH